MPVHAPGRPSTHLPLRRAAGPSPSHRRSGGASLAKRRPLDARVAATSLIDFLLVVVVFLLGTFSASGECGCERPISLPLARHTSELSDTPQVVVRGADILVDGSPGGSTLEVTGSGRLQRIDVLFNALRAKREAFRSRAPNASFPGEVTLLIDQDVPALVVKSVFQTAVLAGYPHVAFAVRRPG
ncbi:MAG: biopolymer transporter ExbD [Polyangiaceae bacterium]|nr:biopolymer transporter ExbD [Polyangiaceae bacterium]